ncbi:PspC domain-containing protein [Pseudobacteriovorax antillogorgiicola]|uniref:Phage shock protein C (PspC) family protein n=1 Tax=Pseudobacteriovorax antillogorgiicola TaxID=1513793 RepID=A0A1Y6BUS9_9BACT|nr:PspC domain-containing protein [Pseudobacteriovorax antillogorgiicola]TCS52399.1 phage shock protein C (PspC) family protein [Pseudobacteriovorax antillogorgiicola]SMF29022.1 phage shock protein C (PspC) family protein [Pseudobacteriovorax antillogorgiicola]
MRFYRDGSKGKIAGVCYGLGQGLGIKVGALRFLCLLSILVLGPGSLLIYLVLTAVLPNVSLDERRKRSNAQASHHLDYVFESLDLRIKKIESYVTTETFAVETRYRQLESQSEASHLSSNERL